MEVTGRILVASAIVSLAIAIAVAGINIGRALRSQPWTPIGTGGVLDRRTGCVYGGHDFRELACPPPESR